MYTKDLIIAIENKLCNKANFAPRIAVQDHFIRNIPERVLEKAITIVLPFSLKSTTSLISKLTNSRINCDRIKMLNFELEPNALSKISPLFQAVFIDDPNDCMKQFAAWLKKSDSSQENIIEIFGESEHIAECFGIKKKKQKVFHGKWYCGYLVLNKAGYTMKKPIQKFQEESEMECDDAFYF
jgi:hypothetical protein